VNTLFRKKHLKKC